MTNFIYFNKRFIKTEEASINPLDRGLLLGDGLFETICIHSGQAVFLKDHWERLTQGAILLNITLPFDYDELAKIVNDCIAINELYAKASCLRLTITRGIGQRGILPSGENLPTVIIHPHLLQASTCHPLTLIVSDIRRNEFSPITRIKSLNYLDNILARLTADKQGADDALLLNTRGFITETTCANFFAAKGGIIYTPPITDGVLPGIVRSKIIELCKLNKISILEKSIALNELNDFSEIFLTNSLIKIKSVSKIANYFSSKDIKIFYQISILFNELIKNFNS